MEPADKVGLHVVNFYIRKNTLAMNFFLNSDESRTMMMLQKKAMMSSTYRMCLKTETISSSGLPRYIANKLFSRSMRLEY